MRAHLAFSASRADADLDRPSVSRKRLRILRIRSAVSVRAANSEIAHLSGRIFSPPPPPPPPTNMRARFEKLELTLPPLFMSRKIRKYADEGGIGGTEGTIQVRILFALVFLVRMTIETSMNDY